MLKLKNTFFLKKKKLIKKKKKKKQDVNKDKDNLVQTLIKIIFF